MIQPDQPIKRASHSEGGAPQFPQETVERQYRFGSGRLILCEQSGLWATAMHRAYPEVRKYWLRFFRWRPAWEAFRSRPTSFLAVELWPENFSEILDGLRWMDCFAPEGRLAILADRRLAEWEWMFRQAGAVHFISSPRAVALLVQMTIRHLKRSAWHLKRPAEAPASLAERIWRRLPWPKAAQKRG